MPEWQWLANFGFAAIVLAFVGKWLARTADKLIDKLLPLGERYVVSTESLHDTLRDNMTSQQALCDSHGRTVAVTSSDVANLKESAAVGCQACRVFIDRKHPDIKSEMEPYFAKIERIIGEA